MVTNKVTNKSKSNRTRPIKNQLLQ